MKENEDWPAIRWRWPLGCIRPYLGLRQIEILGLCDFQGLGGSWNSRCISDDWIPRQSVERDHVQNILIMVCYVFRIELWEDGGMDWLLGVFDNLSV